jgi:hypothetical protein
LSGEEDEEAGAEVCAACFYCLALCMLSGDFLLYKDYGRVGYREKYTLLSASANAETNTPKVKSTTLPTWNKLNRLPCKAPASIVVTLPKERRMMWTGTEMLNAKAQLLSMFTPKNMSAMYAHLRIGTAGVLRVKVGVIWEKEAARAVKMNWERVIRRPMDSVSLVDWRGCLIVIVYRYRAQS